MKNRKLLGWLYLFLVIVCVGISTYSSYRGFSSSLGQLALPFALVVGVMLFGSDIVIRDNINAAKSYFLPLALVFMPALAVSTVSNFNFFYTNFMQQKTAEATYTNAWETFEKNMDRAKTALDAEPTFQNAANTRSLLSQQLANLRSQVLDPLRSGVGLEARQHMRIIEGQLEVPPTKFQVPARGDLTGLEEWLNRYTSSVETNLRAQINETAGGYLDTLDEIEAYLITYRAKTKELQSNRAEITYSEKLDYVNDMKSKTIVVEGKVNELLRRGDQKPIELAIVDRSDGQLGEIGYSLYHGFILRPDFIVTLLLLFLSFLIDCAPLAVAVGLFRPKGQYEIEEARRKNPEDGLNVMN